MAGRGRGRGGGGVGVAGMLKGATWDYDPTLKLESKPNDLFPRHPNIKRPAPLTERELKQIKHYKTLQDELHRGPFFTQPTKRDPDAPAKTFSEDQFNRQYGINRKADMDPFNGVETYSQRYAPKKNELPKLSDRPFSKELFPEELWSTLEGEEGNELRKHITGSMQKKAALLRALSNQDPNYKTQALLQKIHSLTGDEDGDDADEEIMDEEDRDSTFEDEELGDDYNAEQYFDDGEGGDDDDGGGDGGGGDY